jgi:hypothetical protein
MGPREYEFDKKEETLVIKTEGRNIEHPVFEEVTI